MHLRSPECRLVAAINAVILTGSQSNETSEGSGQPVAHDVTLIAKGNHEHEQPQVQEKSWSTVPWSRDFPGKTQSASPKKTAWFTRHVGKRDSTRALSWREYIGSIQKRQPEHDQRADTVSDSWTAQSNKQRDEVCWKRRIRDDEKNLSTSEL